mgnify:CR=1 FL=1
MADNKIRQRHEVPVEDTWATEDMYATDAAWEEELETLNTELSELFKKALSKEKLEVKVEKIKLCYSCRE